VSGAALCCASTRLRWAVSGKSQPAKLDALRAQYLGRGHLLQKAWWTLRFLHEAGGRIYKTKLCVDAMCGPKVKEVVGVKSSIAWHYQKLHL
jgi:hypothetical protein